MFQLNNSKHGRAAAHSVVTGDEKMKRKKPSYHIRFIPAGENGHDAIKDLVKETLKKVIAKNGATVYNFDEVVNKYMSGEMCNDKQE